MNSDYKTPKRHTSSKAVDLVRSMLSEMLFVEIGDVPCVDSIMERFVHVPKYPTCSVQLILMNECIHLFISSHL